MRHDIDFCPARALDIAKIEYNFNIKSTYFVMLNLSCIALKNQKIFFKV